MDDIIIYNPIINDHMTTLNKLYPITSVVPQGSNLGPLVFSIFVNDRNYCITCNKLIFADDLKIYSSINILHDCMVLQNDLNNIFLWCMNNNLNLNISKCKSKFTRKVNSVLFDYYIDTETLLRSSIRLGFVMRQGRVFEDNEVFVKVFFAYVRSKLEYCWICEVSSFYFSALFTVKLINLYILVRQKDLDLHLPVYNRNKLGIFIVYS